MTNLHTTIGHFGIVRCLNLIVLNISINLPGKRKQKTPSCTTRLTLSIIQIQIQIYWQGESRAMPGCNCDLLHSYLCKLSTQFILSGSVTLFLILLWTFSAVWICMWNIRVCLLITYCLFYFSTFNDYIKTYDDNWT